MSPTLGQLVIYRSRTGKYDVPAVVTMTTDSTYLPGVEAGHVPPLSGEDHVHLTVLTPGKPGKRADANDFVNPSPRPVSENMAGCYQEWDIAHDESGAAGTWRIIRPERARP